MFSFLVVLSCARVLWRFYAPKDSLLPAFVCLLFGSTVALLDLGQSTVLVLLGITTFLFAVRSRHDWLAGWLGAGSSLDKTPYRIAVPLGCRALGRMA